MSVPIISLTALAIGAVVGSFLNVVIVRLPKRESLVLPGSTCRDCRMPIRWFDNIPVLSFLWLRGRCRQCGAPIAWRYPLVESATSALFLLAAMRFGWHLELLSAWALLSALVAITAIDLEHQLIPDRITLPGIAIGFLASFLNPSLTWTASLLGVALGGGFISAVIIASRGGMGVGDLKLTAMIGAFLGWKLVALSIFVAVLAGGAVAGAFLLTGLRQRKDRIPFGPFLAAGAVISLWWGNALLEWYLRGFGF